MIGIIIKIVSEVYHTGGQIFMWFAFHFLHFDITFQKNKHMELSAISKVPG